MTDVERIGERKRYVGKFRLYQSSNYYPYVEGAQVNELYKFGHIVPERDIDAMGTYVGNGKFIPDGYNGDLFDEKEIS